MSAFLAIEGLTKRHGGRAALDDISLSVEAGEFVALVGPSGSGKTSLLKSINRLVEPDEGVIRIDGRDVRETPVAALRHGIGYVIQSIGLFPHMNVAENINIVPRLIGSRTRIGPPSCSIWSRSPPTWPAAIRANFPAASSSGSASPGRWRRGRS